MLKTTVLAAMMTMSALALALPPGFFITPEHVASVATHQGIMLSASQVELLSQVQSSVPAPDLEFRSLQRWGSGAKATLRCHDQRQCMPFYVLLSFHKDADRDTALELWNTNLQQAIAEPGKKAPSPVVRAGQPATLIIEGPRLRMELRVICLENGILGKTIRATSTDRKQIYFGQVMSATLLKGRI